MRLIRSNRKNKESSFLYHKQDFDYDYELTGNSNASVNTLVTKKGAKFYPGTMNVSLGLTNELKNKKILETGLFYQHGITGIGIEDVKIKLLGVRGAYWFTVR